MAERKRKTAKTTTTTVVTSGSTIRFEEPKSKRQAKSRVIVQEIHPAAGFTGFLREHAIVGLSIGFILGTQMSAFVKVLVQSFIDPLTQLLFGNALSTRTFYLHFHHHYARFYWGNVVYNLLIIIFLVIFVYVIYKSFNLDALDKPKNNDKK